MKRIMCLVLLFWVLTGCRGPASYETMSDLYYTPPLDPPAEVMLWLPDEAALSVLEDGEGETLYLCDGYTVSVQRVMAGDMDATLRNATGYSQGELKGIRWRQGNVQRYECVWASAGEEGDQLGHAVVLDDGTYHYVVTVMGQAALAGSLADTWSAITASVDLEAAPWQPDTAGDTAQ